MSLVVPFYFVGFYFVSFMESAFGILHLWLGMCQGTMRVNSQNKEMASMDGAWHRTGVYKCTSLPSVRHRLHHTNFAPTSTPPALLPCIYLLSREGLPQGVAPHIRTRRKIFLKTNPANASPGVLIIMALNNTQISLKSYQNIRTWSYLPNTDILTFQNNDQRPLSHHSSDSILQIKSGFQFLVILIENNAFRKVAALYLDNVEEYIWHNVQRTHSP